MKSFGRSFSPAAVAGALVLLAAGPPPASAQVAGRVWSSGGQPGVLAPNAPAPNQSPRVGMPMRSGVVTGRSMGTFGPSLGYNPPVYNSPSFNPPSDSPPNFNQLNTNRNVFNFHPPAYGSLPVYNNGQGYEQRFYNNLPTNGEAPVFRRERPSGPAVNVPDPFEGMPSGGSRRVSGLSDYPFGSGSGAINREDIRPVRPSGSGGTHSDSGYFGGSGLHFPPGSGHGPTTVYRNTYIYNNYNNAPTVAVNAPPLLGGYYYSNYCDSYVPAQTYPSVYSAYAGFPGYIFNASPSVIIVSPPVALPYVTPYLPFDTPNYPVTYNQNNYYVASESRAQEIEEGGEPARTALKNAYPADSYQAAFADIARAWAEGDIAPLRKHIRDSDTRVSIFLNKKYSYSIASGDFVQITRDALDRLHTVSFDFTRLRKAKTGDVTAYGTHVYRTGDSQGSSDGSTVPFDQNGMDAGGSGQETNGDPAAGAAKTVYVSYTLRHRDGQWYIVEVDSADHDLVPEQ